MADKTKKEETKPTDTKEKQFDTESVENAKQETNEKKTEPQQPTDTSDTVSETESQQAEKQETNGEVAKKTEPQTPPAKDTKKPAKKADKPDKKSEGTTQPPKEGKKEHDDDFKYIVRIANTDIDGEKTIQFGIAQIKGIGRHLSSLIIKKTGIDQNTKVGNLTDKQIDHIKEALEHLSEHAPDWMMNHRKEMQTGKNLHLISADLDMRIRDDINLLKMIRSYRGVRHERNLPVRGQRTRGNKRTGLTLGVSKKRE